MAGAVVETEVWLKEPAVTFVARPAAAELPLLAISCAVVRGGKAKTTVRAEGTFSPHREADERNANGVDGDSRRIRGGATSADANRLTGDAPE